MLAALSGCTFKVPVTGTQAEVPIKKRLPLAMGYFLAPELTGYEQREHAGYAGHELVFPVGAATKSRFEGMFARLFEEARAVSQRPTAGAPLENLDGIVEPRLTNISIQGPSVVGWAGTWYVNLDYLFLLSDRTGQGIAQWRVSGTGSSGTGIDWSGMAGSDNAAAALSGALTEVEGRFLTGFAGVPEVQAWLKSKGVNAA